LLEIIGDDIMVGWR